jgi:hypothetical protein
LEMMVRRMLARMCSDWQPAPPDLGFRPGGIRERAIKAMNGNRE